MVIGSRLKEARIKKGLSQIELGEYLGLSKSAISLYENEKRNPTLENIIELIYVLGVSADYLLGADNIVEVENTQMPQYQVVTKEEMLFLNELRKDKLLYEILFQEPKRGIELIKKRIG